MLDPLRLQLYGLLVLGLMASHAYVGFKAYNSGYKSANADNRAATDRLNNRIADLNRRLASESERLRVERQARLDEALSADNGEACKYDEAYRKRLNGLVQ